MGNDPRFTASAQKYAEAIGIHWVYIGPLGIGGIVSVILGVLGEPQWPLWLGASAFMLSAMLAPVIAFRRVLVPKDRAIRAISTLLEAAPNEPIAQRAQAIVDSLDEDPHFEIEGWTEKVPYQTALGMLSPTLNEWTPEGRCRLKLFHLTHSAQDDTVRTWIINGLLARFTGLPALEDDMRPSPDEAGKQVKHYRFLPETKVALRLLDRRAKDTST